MRSGPAHCIGTRSGNSATAVTKVINVKFEFRREDQARLAMDYPQREVTAGFLLSHTASVSCWLSGSRVEAGNTSTWDVPLKYRAPRERPAFDQVPPASVPVCQ